MCPLLHSQPIVVVLLLLLSVPPCLRGGFPRFPSPARRNSPASSPARLELVAENFATQPRRAAEAADVRSPHPGQTKETSRSPGQAAPAFRWSPCRFLAPEY